MELLFQGHVVGPGRVALSLNKKRLIINCRILPFDPFQGHSKRDGHATQRQNPLCLHILYACGIYTALLRLEYIFVYFFMRHAYGPHE